MSALLCVSCLCFLLFQVHPVAAATTAVSFDEQLAMDAVLWSSAAYSSAPDTCHIDGFKLIKQLDTDDCSCVVAVSSSHNAVVVSFRGTNTWKQLIEEVFEAQQMRYSKLFPSNEKWFPKNATSVRYYSEHYLEMRTEMIAVVSSILQQPNNNYTQMYITGHSLGAALATLASIDLIVNFQDTVESIEMINFGSPRVGNVDFAHGVESLFASSSSSFFRVTHRRDPVPHGPYCPGQKQHEACKEKDVSGPYFGFHVALEVFYDGDMPYALSSSSSYSGADVDGGRKGKQSGYVECTQSPYGEDPSCANQYWEGDYYTEDHLYYYSVNVGEYCAALAPEPSLAP